MNDREDIQRYRSDSAGSTLPYAGLVALAAIDDNSQTLLSNDILNPQKLSSIEVRDTANSLVKKWNFSQSYFNQSVISHLSAPLNLAGNLLKNLSEILIMWLDFPCMRSKTYSNSKHGNFFGLRPLFDL